MSDDDIKATITELVADELAIEDDGSITPTSRLREDLGADSLDMVELTMRVEEHYDIEIPDDDIDDKLITVGDLVTYVEKRVEKRR